MIEPFDSRDTVVGQGTVAAEIVAQLASLGKELDTVLVPVGGGGLLSGVLSYLADMSPATKVVGVEPKGAASLGAARNAGEPVTLGTIDPFVDGAAVKRIGEIPWQVFNAHRDATELHTADEGAVCTEMLGLYQNEGIIAEPAGALVHRGLRHYFLVNFPQEAGQLRHFLNDILGEEDDIVLFEYLKKNNRETGAALVGIELARAEDLGPLIERMEDSPIGCRRLEPGTPEYDYIVAG